MKGFLYEHALYLRDVGSKLVVGNTVDAIWDDINYVEAAVHNLTHELHSGYLFGQHYRPTTT